MPRAERFRLPAVVLLALTLALQGAAGLFVQPSRDACPLQGDDCCKALRLTCCHPAPASSPATVPLGAQTLRVPVLTASIEPLSTPAIASIGLDIAAHPASPPWRQADLPVFLHALLI